MSLKNRKSQPAGNMKAVKEEISEAEKSTARSAAIQTNIFKAIAETTKTTDGDITIFEIMDALLRISHSYNKRFLDQQNGKDETKKG